MNDKEWAEQELAQYRKEEIEAVKRIAKAREDLTKAKTELAAAKEYLEGVRGGIKEFEFQMNCLTLSGRLP
jgi:predicted  nucleic acid-binding Zn-ribbon protein